MASPSEPSGCMFFNMADPKSAIFRRPSTETKMFSGFMSRCTKSCACTCMRPVATSCATRRTKASAALTAATLPATLDDEEEEKEEEEEEEEEEKEEDDAAAEVAEGDTDERDGNVRGCARSRPCSVSGQYSICMKK